MSKFSREITQTLEKKLEDTAHDLFDVMFLHLLTGPKDGPEDYPVAAAVLDRTGSIVLGEGIADDARTQTLTGHAEANAIIDACLDHSEHLTDGGIVVSTLESCSMCMGNTANRLGTDSLIAFVTSRREIEEMGHVNPRSSSYRDRPVQEVRLKNPELQQKGKILYGSVTRDPDTGISVVNRELLVKELENIGLKYQIRH